MGKSTLTGGNRKQKRVLLVEDERFLVDMYKVAFSRTDDYMLECAENVQDGLLAMERFAPDLVLLDLIMPMKKRAALEFASRGGFDFLKVIRKESRWKDTPIIVLTNLDSPIDRRIAKRFHVDDYIVKANMLPRQVIERIREIL